MIENKRKFYYKILEYLILPIIILIVGLMIEYKTGYFQGIVEDNTKDTLENKFVIRQENENMFQLNMTRIVDSFQSQIFDNGYLVFKQNEIEKYRTDIRVYDAILAEAIQTCTKVKEGKIYDGKDSVYRKTYGSNKVELQRMRFVNEIVTISNNKFYRMRTMYDETYNSINLTVGANSNNDFPMEQVLVKIDNRYNKCYIVGYYHKSLQEKYLKSQKQLSDSYTDLMIFWKKILD